MSDTKKRILACSLHLFNEYGWANVSQRRITEELKISPGNLTYHFKRKADIEEALYLELVVIFDQWFALMDDQKYDIEQFVEQLEKGYLLISKYRFIFIDMVDLMRNNQRIAAHYSNLLQKRTQQFEIAATHLVQKGILRKKNFSKEHYYLFQQVQLIFDFYFSSLSIKGIKVEDAQLDFSQLVLHTIYPYFTKAMQQKIEKQLCKHFFLD